MADSQERSAAEIWRQRRIPVIYRRGRGMPLMVKLPFAPDNFDWLRNDNRSKPEYDKQYKCWYVPNSWFDDLIRRLLERFGHVYVIQPFRALEQCAPACWNATGFECECSCMGQNHGSSAPGKWWVISDTFALRWHDRELACRLLKRGPSHPQPVT